MVLILFLALGLGVALYSREQAIDSATFSPKNPDMAQVESSNPLRIILSR
jgi:hypothetical protein